MKRQNYVAKHSRHKTGAGYHTSKKDYSRKNKMKDIDDQMKWCVDTYEEMTEEEQEVLEQLIHQQENTKSASLFQQLEEEIEALFEEVESRINGG